MTRQAMKHDWLSPLLEAHLTPCTPEQALRLLELLPLPRRRLTIRFLGAVRGTVRQRRGVYLIRLPSQRGICFRHLTVGLVLHEASHVLDHHRSGSWGHGPKFCRRLRSALATDWKGVVPMTSNFREIYDRHRGPYALIVTHRDVNGKGKPSETAERLRSYSAEDAHEEARIMVNRPNGNVTSIHVYSETEGQYIGAFYKRGETYRPWHDEEEGRNERLELPDQRAAATLVREREEPVQEVDDPIDAGVPVAAASDTGGPVRDVPAEKPAKPRAAKPAKLPGDRFPVVRGKALQLGNATPWPPSAAATLVREFFTVAEPGRRATPAEVVAALGAELKELGVEHPASLVSRLKQGGFLRVADE